jgi:hypothetical protein
MIVYATKALYGRRRKMTDSMTALLLDAKKEYLTRLYEIVMPPLTMCMQSMYLADESRDRYINFQKRLCQIPFWNTYVIQEKTTAITRQYPYFENLMAACIVTYVKVLSSIRLSSGRPSIKLKLPTVDVFVHELYKQVAQTLYYDPFIMDQSLEKLQDVVFESIEKAIRRLIPFEDILTSYLEADQGGPPEPPPQSPEDDESSSSSDDEEEDIQVPMKPDTTANDSEDEEDTHDAYEENNTHDNNTLFGGSASQNHESLATTFAPSQPTYSVPAPSPSLTPPIPPPPPATAPATAPPQTAPRYPAPPPPAPPAPVQPTGQPLSQAGGPPALVPSARDSL